MEAMRRIHPGWIAGTILVLVALWLASGVLGRSADPQASAAEPGAPARIKVRTLDSQAQWLTREARLSARTAPLRSVLIRAETSGRVEQVTVEAGQSVAAGTVILRLAAKDAPLQLARAKALLKQRQLQYEAAQRMQGQGLQSPVELATARANQVAAEADVLRWADAVEHTVIKAPFPGVLEQRMVEVGDFVSVGDALGRIIQTEPFLVRGYVSEDVVGYLERGQTAQATLAGGQSVAGTLRFVASQADAATRTFLVELEVPRQTGRLLLGASAVLILPLEKVRAHQLEPASLALDEDGDFGIKSVDAQGLVQFHAARIVQSRDATIWLGGLPESLRVITAGQGFISAGDRVDAIGATQP